MKAKGFEKVTFFIPADEACNIRLVAEMMRDDKDLTISTLRSRITGKMVSINRG